MKQRILSIFLTLMLCLSLFPVTALAADEGLSTVCSGGMSPGDDLNVGTKVLSWRFGENPEGFVVTEENGAFYVQPSPQENGISPEELTALLPQTVVAQISADTPEGSEGEEKTIAISRWECESYAADPETGAWPAAGEYVFTAAFEEEYVFETAPEIIVSLGAANMVMPLATTVNSNEDYYSDLFTKNVSGNTTTYKFHTLEEMESTFRMVWTGDLVIDLTEITDNTTKSDHAWISLYPQTEASTVTILGSAARTYNLEIYVMKALESLTLKDFRNTYNVRAEGGCTLRYIGECALAIIYPFSEEGVIVENAEANASLQLDYISYNDGGPLTLKGKILCDKYIYSTNLTLDGCDFTFTDTAYVDQRFQAETILIQNNSTVRNVCRIVANADEGSSITIQNSQVMFSSVNSWSLLGNAEKILIEHSIVTGLSANDACIGGDFSELTIKGSEVYAQSESGPAIGAGRNSNTLHMIIAIIDSKVEAASKSGAAIGAPYYGTTEPTDPHIPHIYIGGASQVTASSIYAAAIGGGRWGRVNSIPDEGQVELGVGTGGIGSWGEGETISGETSANALRSAGTPSLLSITADEIEAQIAQNAKLTEGSTLTISETESGSPSILARSGVLAIYAEINTNLDLVQTTMMKQSSGSSSYVLYAAENPASVTVGSETMGDLGYGYASLATILSSEHHGDEMWFGNAKLRDIVSGTGSFTIESSKGFQPFYVTPTLVIGGTVQLVNGNDSTQIVGSAQSGTTLKADISGLTPASVRTGSGKVAYQWYRGTEAIQGATKETYTLTDTDSQNVVYCVVTGTGSYTGVVTSNGVSVLAEDAPEVAAPVLEDRDEDSITLVKTEGIKSYGIIRPGDSSVMYQDSNEFTGLNKGTAYIFIQKDDSENLSSAVSFSTRGDIPSEADFTIDYVNETLRYPADVNLYSDEDCTIQINNSSSLSVQITDYIAKSGEQPIKLYARYIGATGVDECLPITIPSRPAITPLSEDEVMISSGSIRFTGADGVSYQLQNASGQVVGSTQLGDGTPINFSGLQAGETYTLKMRMEASNLKECFHSDQYDMKITIPVVMTGTLLVPAGKSDTREYDLSYWLGTDAISAVSETVNEENLINALTFSGTTLHVQYVDAQEGQKTTLKVTAQNNKELTLTVEFVEVIAEENGILWTRLIASPDYVDGTWTMQTIAEAWKSKADQEGYPATGMESFALRPLYEVGGLLAQNSGSATMTWRPKDSAAVKMENGSFLVLHIPKQNSGIPQELTYTRKTDSLQFTAKNQGGLYAVLYKPATEVSLAVDLKKGEQTAEEFAYSEELTAEITVSPKDTGVPNGTVSLYLGDPENGGKKLGGNTLKNGKATLSYTVTTDVIAEGKQTLYIVYEGNYDYLKKSTTKEVTFKKADSGISLTVKNEDTVINQFTYGDTITIEGKVTVATSSVQTTRALAAPAANQAALFLGDTQLTDPVLVGSNGKFTIQYNTGLKGITPSENSQTLTVKYGGSDSLNTGSATAGITLSPKSVTATVNTPVTKVYDGKTDVHLTLTVAQGDLVKTTDVLTVTAPGTFASVNAGTNISVTVGTLSVSGADAAYYDVTAGSATVTGSITKTTATPKEGSLTVMNHWEGSYTFDLSALLPELEEGLSFDNVNYTLDSVALNEAYYTTGTAGGASVNGSTLTLPVESVDTEAIGSIGTIKVKISSDNYEDMTATIKVTAENKTQVTITGVTAQNGTYEAGKTHAGYTGTISSGAYTGDYTILYEGRNTDYGRTTVAPTDAGDYTVTIAIPDTVKEYQGSISLDFSISKADVKLNLTAQPDSMNGGGNVTLTLTGLPAGETAKVSCSEKSISVTAGENNTWTAVLPDGEKSYTFTAAYSGSSNYNGATATVGVEVGKKAVTVEVEQSDGTYGTALADPTVTVKNGSVVLNESDGTTTIKYVGRGDTVYEESGTKPTDAGTYTVTVNYSSNAYYGTGTAEFEIHKANPTISNIEAEADGPTRATVSATVSPNPETTGLTVKYAKSDTETAPTEEGAWQTTNTFTGLTENTTYYFFVRVNGNDNYNTVTSDGYQLKTPAKSVSGIAISNQPANLSYTSGDALNLNGLSVTISYNDNSTETVDWGSEEWTEAGLIVSLANGTALMSSQHDGKKITITYGEVTAETGALTIGKGNQAALTISGLPEKVYSGDSFTLAVSGGSGRGAVTWEVISGNATVKIDGEGNAKVQVTGTGEIVIRAAKAGDADYNAAYDEITFTAGSRSSGGGTTSYTVVVKDTEHGTVTVKPDSPSRGQTVTITADPDDGYETGAVTVTDQSAGVVAVTDNGNGTYSFVQPGSNVTVEVTFRAVDDVDNVDTVADCLRDGTCPMHDFSDLNLSSWYHDGVHYCLQNGLMVGTETAMFSPESTTTRAQIVTLLWRLEGEPSADRSSFNDVTAGSYYEAAVGWAAASDIVKGVSATSFAPNDPITREQFAAILYRYAQHKGYDASVGEDGEDMNLSGYADASELSGYAVSAMKWACGKGLVNGTDGNRLDTKGTATRAQAAAMIQRFCELNAAN